MQQFGINGFGRIGRTSLRVWWQFSRDLMDLRMINTSGSMEIEDWAHLLTYDSNYGLFSATVTTERHQSKDDVTDADSVLGKMTISQGGESKTIVVTAQRDPTKVPWDAQGVKVVLESTGVFTSEEKAAQHFQGGAEYVIISAPAKGGDISTGILGVNQFTPGKKVLSNASCTTNCIAPVMLVMQQSLGVEKALMTTMHAYTDDQNLHDNSHRDLRRARAAAFNIVPTTTGAATATSEVIPELKDKFDGMAVRVPVPVGSLSDIVFVASRNTTIEEVNQLLTAASQQDRWRNILAVTTAPLVSSDIVGRRESAIVDLSLTNVIGGNLVKIISWYDNEWGYCNRLVEQVNAIPS